MRWAANAGYNFVRSSRRSELEWGDYYYYTPKRAVLSALDVNVSERSVWYTMGTIAGEEGLL